MGKSDNQRWPVVQQHTHGSASPTSICRRCSINIFDFNCVVVLVLSVAAFLSAIFWVLPNRCGESGFDADESIKLSGTSDARIMNNLFRYSYLRGFWKRDSIAGLQFCFVSTLKFHELFAIWERFLSTSYRHFQVRSLVIISGFLIGEVEMSSLFLKPKGQISTVQAYFKLQRPASELIPYIARLEYDINEEIGVPFFKVAVLSIHQAGLSNWTNVVFGFCSNVSNNPISPMSLSLLKSSLVDLFLRQYNMTFTSSIFGETSSFEILKFPDGISIMLGQAAMFLRTPQVLFNFTLNSSICEIRENLLELKEQLRIGLQLVPTEVVCIQATNKHGSTKDPPVTIGASVLSDIGTLQPERLKQLAQRITESPSIENLGLDHSVFGKVKEVSLSSFLNHSLYAPTPTPSPSPSPSPAPSTEQIYNASPSLAPSRSPVLSTGHNCYSFVPSDASPTPAPSSSNAPCVSLSTPNPPTPSLNPPYSEPPLATPESDFSPSVSPLPSDSYATRGLDKWIVESLVSSSHFSSSFAPSMSSGTMWRRIWRFYSTGVLTLVLAM